ncbi:MAG: GHKL domain-containing protein [Cyclobacteriaceae bacterium]|nr:GHKL domain-containing protein [Cyclobacteriaceae bacterium]
MKKFFRYFIIGNDHIPSFSDYKRAMLRGTLALIAALTSAFYLFLDLVNDIQGYASVYVINIVISIVTIFLNKRKKYSLASAVLLVGLNTSIYVLASNDTYRTGVYVYLVCISLMALGIFGFTEIWRGMLIVAYSVALFLLAYVFKVRLLPMPMVNLTPEYIDASFTVNILVAFVLCASIMYFLMSVNHHSEAALQAIVKEQQIAEQKIKQQNEELVKANTELDRFVYSASHDLRAPLSSISGLLMLAEMTEDINELRTYHDMMKGRIDRLEQFIRDIIQYSRNARFELTIEPVPIGAELSEIVDTLKYTQEGSHVQFDVNLNDIKTIFTDKTRLRVVLFNLISNAVNYQDKLKEKKFVKITVRKDAGKSIITIEDNGVGIAPVHHSKIFSMFYRASDISQGSGLGLYIVSETLEKLGGTITFQSILGEGTRFMVELPARAE